MTIGAEPQIDSGAPRKLLHGNRLTSVRKQPELINCGQFSARVHLSSVGIEDASRHEVGEQILAAQLSRTTTLVDESADHCMAAGSARRLIRRWVMGKSHHRISVTVSTIINRRSKDTTREVTGLEHKRAFPLAPAEVA